MSVDEQDGPGIRAHSEGRALTASRSSGDDERVHRALLATIRHELRTPINGILGYSEMLLEDEEETGAAESDLAPDLRRIHDAGAQLLVLVNEVLDPARLGDGKDLDMDSFVATLRRNLRTPITTIIGYSELLVEDATAAERGDIVPDLEKIRGAALRFHELIDDVVSFSTAAREADSDLLGRNLDLESTGATTLVHDVVTTMRSLNQQDSQAHTESGTLLIVDDNEINRDVLTRHLERQGHTVTAVESGRAAFEAVRARAFDLVLLDILMPEVNGYEVLQRLKSDPATHDIPVIMISALDELDAVVRCIEMGAEDFLTKPFNPILLRARANACLEKKRLRDQEREYLRHVSELTAAAAEVEANEFDSQRLAATTQRSDALGQLARVFQRMASEVVAREQRLKHEVQQLRIEIDEAKKARQVSEITETDYFRSLQQKARDLRTRKSPTA